MISLQTQKRAYLRGIPSLSLDRQKELAAKANCDHTYEWLEGGRKINARDRWLNSLRPGDEAWLADIRVLVLPKPPRTIGPQRDLGSIIAAVLATGAIIVDDRTGITSRDRKDWANHVEWALGIVAQGERNRRAVWRNAAKARAGKGLAPKWKSDAMVKDRESAARIWRDAKYRSADAARADLPEELRGASMRTLYNIFGQRRPGDKSAGGRGKRKTR